MLAGIPNLHTVDFLVNMLVRIVGHACRSSTRVTGVVCAAMPAVS